MYVPEHSNVLGDEIADSLAKTPFYGISSVLFIYRMEL